MIWLSRQSSLCRCLSRLHLIKFVLFTLFVLFMFMLFVPFTHPHECWPPYSAARYNSNLEAPDHITHPPPNEFA